MEEISNIFAKHGFRIGRMIASSKSAYWERHPNNDVIFNANILVFNCNNYSGKVWFGDLDVTLDSPKLEKVADELNTNLYILRESDARFESENQSIKNLMFKAQHVIRPKNIFMGRGKN